jgi:hypothetical protein
MGLILDSSVVIAATGPTAEKNRGKIKSLAHAPKEIQSATRQSQWRAEIRQQAIGRFFGESQS